jgi:hypothetical protein
LDFIEDGLGSELAEEAAGIVGGEGAGVGIFEGEIGGIGDGGSGEGGLAGLTWAGDDDDGIGGEAPLKERGEDPRNGSERQGGRHSDQMNTAVYTWSSASSQKV